jgi:hypothetical protein
VVIVYLRQLVDLDKLGLVDAQSRHDANVIVAEGDGVDVSVADPPQRREDSTLTSEAEVWFGK